jgi:hypothetical protein
VVATKLLSTLVHNVVDSCYIPIREFVVMETEDRLVIQQRALEALQESTRNLLVAEQLINVGNITEAERLKEEARQHRNISVWLMKQARPSDLAH